MKHKNAMSLSSESQHILQFLPVYLLPYENLATTTRKGRETFLYLKPWDMPDMAQIIGLLITAGVLIWNFTRSMGKKMSSEKEG
jgi:hypothetical protein